MVEYEKVLVLVKDSAFQDPSRFRTIHGEFTSQIHKSILFQKNFHVVFRMFITVLCSLISLIQ